MSRRNRNNQSGTTVVDESVDSSVDENEVIEEGVDDVSDDTDNVDSSGDGVDNVDNGDSAGDSADGTDDGVDENVTDVAAVPEAGDVDSEELEQPTAEVTEPATEEVAEPAVEPAVEEPAPETEVDGEPEQTEAETDQVEAVDAVLVDEPLAGTGEAVQLNQDGTEPVVQVTDETQDTEPTEPTAPVVVEPEAPALETPETPAEVVEAVASPLSNDVSTWTLDQVCAVVRGETLQPSGVSDREVVERGGKFIFSVTQEPAAWGFKDIYNWLKNGDLPTQSSGGFYPNDPRRARKVPNEWSKEELVDFVRGELPASMAASEEELYDEIIAKWKIGPEWSNEDIEAYVLFNRRPVFTENGFLTHDRVRARKPAAYWTIKELVAFARDEIPATEVATEKDLFNELRKRLSVSDSYTEERLKQLMIDYKEEPLPMSLAFVKQNLERYEQGMGRGVAVSEEAAAGFQTLLFNTMTRVLRLEGRDFVDGWTMILDFVNAHHITMFGERHAFRGITVIKLSERDRKSFEQLLNLAVKTCEPSTRYQQANNTNFQVTLRGITDEAARQRVLSYYQVGH